MRGEAFPRECVEVQGTSGSAGHTSSPIALTRKVILAALLFGFSALVLAAQAPQPGKTLVSANVSVSDEWITVAMDFSPGIPEYKTQILIAPDRLEIIFLDTKIADKALADGGRVGKFPLSEIAPYQGSLNASLSFHLAYEADPVIGTSEKTLTVSFPRKAFYYREIALVTPC